MTCVQGKGSGEIPCFPGNLPPSSRVPPFAVCFFSPFFHGFQKPYLLYGIWQQACVGGFRKHQDAKEIEGGDRQGCVCMCHLYLCGSGREQTVRLMYPGLPPEETKQYLHGDFVLSPSPCSYCSILQSISGAMLSLHPIDRLNAFT